MSVQVVATQEHQIKAHKLLSDEKTMVLIPWTGSPDSIDPMEPQVLEWFAFRQSHKLYLVLLSYIMDPRNM